MQTMQFLGTQKYKPVKEGTKMNQYLLDGAPTC